MSMSNVLGPTPSLPVETQCRSRPAPPAKEGAKGKTSNKLKWRDLQDMVALATLELSRVNGGARHCCFAPEPQLV